MPQHFSANCKISFVPAVSIILRGNLKMYTDLVCIIVIVIVFDLRLHKMLQNVYIFGNFVMHMFP